MEQILLYIRIGLFLSEEKSMRHSHALAGAVKMQDIWSRFLSVDCSPPGHIWHPFHWNPVWPQTVYL